MTAADRPSRRTTLAAALLAVVLAGCARGPIVVDDPIGELAVAPAHPARQLAAIAALDTAPADAEQREASLAAMHRLMYAPFYTVDVREAAFRRLASEDQPALQRTIRLRLPRMPLSMNEWRARLCGLIADEGWVDLTPALVSSWARPISFIDDAERSEYLALARLYGPEEVIDVIFEMFVESNGIADRGLRNRCWDLLHRLGSRDRLIALLWDAEPPPDDPMLDDLRAGALELGIVPRNGQEIEWLRRLRRPEQASFWSQAVAATGQVAPDRRAQLELRDLPVIVSAMLHDPESLQLSETELYDGLESALRGQKHYSHGSQLYEGGQRPRDRLFEQRDRLAWSDLLAMRMAVRAVRVPQVAAHLFNYAERDRLDVSTEYGGVMRLDAQGRFEIVEFLPRIRHHDNKFIASQAMFDAGYTALFHFHFHVQRERNERYAGPGPGDAEYAELNRCNCLVFTSVGWDRLNVDFYRHDSIVVDLGVITRP